MEFVAGSFLIQIVKEDNNQKEYKGVESHRVLISLLRLALRSSSLLLKLIVEHASENQVYEIIVALIIVGCPVGSRISLLLLICTIGILARVSVVVIFLRRIREYLKSSRNLFEGISGLWMPVSVRVKLPSPQFELSFHLLHGAMLMHSKNKVQIIGLKNLTYLMLSHL